MKWNITKHYGVRVRESGSEIFCSCAKSLNEDYYNTSTWVERLLDYSLLVLKREIHGLDRSRKS